MLLNMNEVNFITPYSPLVNVCTHSPVDAFNFSENLSITRLPFLIASCVSVSIPETLTVNLSSLSHVSVLVLPVEFLTIL